MIADEERLMPHLHLSLQSGDDLILKRMKRRHSRSEAIQFCAQVRRLRPDIALGADIIAGFPTESDEMFARSQDLVEECDLTFLHVFPYSPRPGTPAARMPQVSGEQVKERARRLRATGEAALQRRLASEIGATRRVLIESARQGRTEHFMPVAISGETPGAVLTLKMAGHDGARLILRSVHRPANDHHSPFQPQARSRSCKCAGAGAATCTGSLFFEIGIPISRECRCSLGSPKRGPLP